MRKTELIRQINREDRKYKYVKFKLYLLMKLSCGEKRRSLESTYSIFEHDLYYNKNNGLPEAKYFKPTDIIIYDLIKKEDLRETKNGLIKLFKKCYSHKFVRGGKSELDIDNMIDRLDQTINSGNSWYNIGLFDFAYNEQYELYIDHFEIGFHNFSSSYVAIEVKINLADAFVEEIKNFIKNPYIKPGKCVHRLWGKKKEKQGQRLYMVLVMGCKVSVLRVRLFMNNYSM